MAPRHARARTDEKEVLNGIDESKISVNFAAMANANDQDDQAILLNPVDDAVIPGANSVGFFETLEFFASCREGIMSQR